MMTLLSALALAAAPLPQGERLPPPDFADKEVIAVIDALFAALEKGDGPALLQLVYPEGRVTGRGTFPGGATGLRSRSFTEYAARMTPGSGFHEQISDMIVERDGDVAMVWAPFTVSIAGKVVSCGYDHFDFVRENGQWKVMNLTFSSRTEGCGA
jgi:ketosteroid isomerase-like protein